jgi:hypothetical protein
MLACSANDLRANVVDSAVAGGVGDFDGHDVLLLLLFAVALPTLKVWRTN